MANVKITELTATTNPDSTDVLPIVDVAADVTKKVTIAALLENAGNGSAAAPAFSFSSDPNTGMFRGAEDSLRFATGGTIGLVIANDQNVGIGTATPAKKLVVIGDGSFNGVIAGRGGGDVSTNTALGASCLDTNTTGGGNVAVGFQCLRLNTEGASNVAVGRECLEQNTTGSSNVAIGKSAMISNTTAGFSIAVGQNTLLDNTVGTRNVAIGHQALQTNVAISRNTAVGYNAMRYANSDATEQAKNNVAYGYQALRGSSTAANNTGGNNVAIGGNTLLDCTSGNSNVAIGHNAGTNVTTSIRNVLVGFSAGDEITTGSNNTIIGDIAGTAALASTVIVGAGTAERFRVDNGGRFLLGASTAATSPSPSKLQIIGDTTATSSQLISKSSSDNNGSTLFLSKSRGTKSSPAIVNDGDKVGRIIFTAHDGTDFESQIASIIAFVDGTPGGDDTPGRLVFLTTADGANGATERMRIKSDGTINFSNVQTFADDTAAGTGGLVAGDVYKTSAGDLKIKA